MEVVCSRGWLAGKERHMTRVDERLAVLLRRNGNGMDVWMGEG